MTKIVAVLISWIGLYLMAGYIIFLAKLLILNIKITGRHYLVMVGGDNSCSIIF